MTADTPSPTLLAPKPSLTYRLVSSLLVFPVFEACFEGRPRAMSGFLPRAPGGGCQPWLPPGPTLLGHALGRPVAFVAKTELFEFPIGPLIAMLYPFAGASDRDDRTATTRLQGWATGVFLDGTRQPDGRLTASGAALLSARSRAPRCLWPLSTATEPWVPVAAGLAWCR